SAGDEARARQDEKTARLQSDTDHHKARLLSAGLALDQGINLCEEGRPEEGLAWMANALTLLPEGQEDLEFAIRANLSAWRHSICVPRFNARRGTPMMVVAFSPDGKTILTADWGNHWNKPGPAQACLWDAATWKELLPRPVTHPRSIVGAAFS